MSNLTNRVSASILVVLLCSNLAAVESTQHSEGQAITAHQWDVIDIHFEASGLENPLSVTLVQHSFCKSGMGLIEASVAS
jgi:hypothetical protein